MQSDHPSRRSRARQPGRFAVRLAAWLAGACLPGLLTGCYTPQTRARERAATFRQLAPADRALVLRGQVRNGMDKEAVYIAWGAPTHTQPAGPTQGPLEAWVYTRTFLGPDTGYFGVPRGLTYSPARRRYYYDRDDYYPSPVYIRAFGQVSTEVPYYKAVFDRGRVVSFEQKTFSPAPDDERK